MDFRLSEEQQMLKKLAHDFVEKEIRPYIIEWDEKCIGPDHAFKHRLAELGLLGISLPEEYGGQGLTYLDAVIALEEFAKVSVPWSFPIFEASFGPVIAINMFGTEQQKRRFFPQVCAGDMMVSIGMTEPESGFSPHRFKH